MSKKGSVLLVDDDQDDQQLILDILESCGIKNKVTCLSNGKEALDHLLKMKELPF
jgi:CheY-like chemotaxis protein